TTIGATASLPGFNELVSTTESLTQILKSTPCERDRCEALQFKIETIVELTVEMSQLGIEYFQRLENELRRIEDTYQVATTRGGNSYLRAQSQLEAFENLDKRLDYILEIAKTTIQLKDMTIRMDDQGYFGTNKIPNVRADNLKYQGWEFMYELRINYYRIADDWGQMYRKLLKESMDSMPGSFPAEDSG
ncbi:hypothetical protein FRC07_012905, partial [Ceratobasidium sp. 392]